MYAGVCALAGAGLCLLQRTISQGEQGIPCEGDGEQEGVGKKESEDYWWPGGRGIFSLLG